MCQQWQEPYKGVERLRHDVSIDFIDDESVVLDPATQKIYRLDRVSTLIWCLLAEGCTLAAVRNTLHESYGLPLAEADRYVGTALADWSHYGLLDDGRSRQAEKANVDERRPQWRESAPRPAATEEAVARLGLRLAGIDILLNLHAASPLDQLRAVFEHLAVEPAGQPAMVCALAAHGNGYAVTAGNRTLARCITEQEIVPTVKAALATLVIETTDALGALHAAALACGGGAIVFPGAAGAGKSTLAAALVHNGFDLVGDDTVFLSADGSHVHPMPLAICLKEKAWAVVAGFLPDIDRLPDHRRGDGHLVRYVVPRRESAFAMVTEPLPIARLIFPSYCPGSAPTVRRLSGGAALKQLLPQFFPTKRRFNRDMINRLIAMIEGVDAFAISYRNLDDAVAAVRQTLSS